jgi:hypothetical protein
MFNQIDYFKRERTILSTSINIEDQYLSSSDKLLSYIQTQIKDVYHVVIDRASFDNRLYGTNLIIVYSFGDTNYYYSVNCNNYTLTEYSKNHLLFFYPKFVKFKKITLLYGLYP